MSRRVYFIWFFLTFLLYAGSGEAADRRSLISVVANPDTYQGQKIIVEGVFCAEKDGIGLYTSVFACENSLTSYGVELELGDKYFVQREKFGHKKPIRVQGIISVKPDNQITFDKLNFSIALTDVKFVEVTAISPGVHELSAVEKIRAINRLIISWKNAMKARRYSEVASLMVFPDESELLNTPRVKWVLFEAPEAVAKVLDKLVETSIFVSDIDDDDIYVCMARKRSFFSSISEMPEPLETNKGFCFNVYYYSEDGEYLISPVNFGYY